MVVCVCACVRACVLAGGGGGIPLSDQRGSPHCETDNVNRLHSTHKSHL